MLDTILTWLTKLLEKAATLWAAFSAGQASVKNKGNEDALKITKEQLDIANAPDPSVDDVAGWLSGGTKDYKPGDMP